MDERKLRGIIRQVIRETRAARAHLLVEYDDGAHGALWKAFVEPFVDVVRSANLFTKDLLNIFGLAFETIITFDPEKLAKSRDQYERRQGQIAQEWKPIMDRADASLKNTDIGLVTMAFAPNVFFASQAAKLGSAGYDTAKEYLGAMGIIDYVTMQGGDLNTNLVRWLEEQERESRSGRRRDGGGGIASRLSKFFFGESLAHEGDRLNEAEGVDKSKGGGGGSLTPDQIKGFFDERTGLFSQNGPLGDLLSQSRKELEDAKLEQARDLVGVANTVIAGLQGISNAQNPGDLDDAVVKFEAQLAREGDKEAVDLGPIKQAIKELNEAMKVKYDEVIKQSGEEASGEAPSTESKPKDVETVAKRAAEEAFKQGAEELRRRASDAMKQVKGNYTKTIAEELVKDIDESVKSSPAGKELINKLEAEVRNIGR